MGDHPSGILRAGRVRIDQRCALPHYLPPSTLEFRSVQKARSLSTQIRSYGGYRQ